MAVKFYISGEGGKGVRVKRVILKEGVGPRIKEAIARITSIANHLSVSTGGRVFKDYVLGAKPSELVNFSGCREVYPTIDPVEISWFGEKTTKRVHHPAPLNDMWGQGYYTDDVYRCKIGCVTRYPVTLSVLQYLTGNKNSDYELELFKLFLTQNAIDMNELERSFEFLSSMISVQSVDKINLMFMIKEMYPDLYHFVVDVMPFVVIESKESFDDGVFKISDNTAQNNAHALKLIRRLANIANGSYNS